MHARYTMTLYDARHSVENFFSFIDFVDSNHTNELINAIQSMWDIYEIAGETISEQRKYMQDTFNEYKGYYAEKITEYDKKLEWTDEDYYKIYSHAESGNTNLHSDLPNKQINPTDYYAYPTDTDKADATSDSTNTDKSRLISLRKQYMSQIKDYYREFALRFAHDFLHMF